MCDIFVALLLLGLGIHYILKDILFVLLVNSKLEIPIRQIPFFRDVVQNVPR